MAGTFVTPWLLAAALLALPAPSRANPSPLTAEVQPFTLRPRTQAPALLNLKLRSQSRTPLEGTLELDAWTNDKLVFQQEIPDLALINGDSNQRLLLPPPPMNTPAVDEVRLRFATPAGSYDLGRFPVATTWTGQRQYLIGVCRPDPVLSAKPSFTWQALRPELILPDAKRLTAPLVSSPGWFAPEDLPSPLGLCAFDVVLLEGPALAALSPRQLDDLAVWVEGGGSLCIVAPRTVDAEHLSFLNRLAGSKKVPTPIMRNPDGTMDLSPSAAKSSDPSSELPSPISEAGDSEATPFFLYRRTKLGRTVVAFASPPAEDQLAQWNKPAQFLARLDSAGGKMIWKARGGQSGHPHLLYEVQSRLLANLPKSARMIPLPVASAILGAFLVWIGPGEWFILGWLRRRRWTWITFPAASAGCAILTGQVAEHYLGSGNQRLTLIVTDYSEQGRALRENRVDLWFAGRDEEVLSEMHQALVVPSSNNADSFNPWVGSSGGVAYSGSGGRAFYLSPRIAGWPSGHYMSTVHTYRGRVAGRYSLAHSLTQWTPYFERSLTFTPATTGPRLRWEALDVHGAFEDSPIRAEFAAAKIGAEGWSVRVFRTASDVSVYPVGTKFDLLAWELSVPDMAVAVSPGARADLLDIVLDHETFDWVVVAERRVGREILLQRCVYHSAPDD